MDNNTTPSPHQSATRSTPVRSLIITGGTGTIGRALTAHFLHTDPALHIRILSRSEYLQQQMKAVYPHAEYMLGDIRDASRVHAAFLGMDAVIHAAALKHVDRSEESPGEFLRTNVLGTENVLRAATSTDVQRVVFISSDKAVAPINTYGATKMLAERLCLRSAACHMVSCNVVRYGNVMGSRGSVVEVFLRALVAGNPLPVTDLTMTRFHLDTCRAVKVICAALDASMHSSIFIPHLEAFSVDTLCRAMLDVPAAMPLHEGRHIRLIGTRTGERPYELLMTPEECPYACWHDNAEQYELIYRLAQAVQVQPCLRAYCSATWPYRLTIPELRKALHAVQSGTAHDHCGSQRQPPPTV